LPLQPTLSTTVCKDPGFKGRAAVAGLDHRFEERHQPVFKSHPPNAGDNAFLITGAERVRFERR
jgi:hypothetical protein